MADMIAYAGKIGRELRSSASKATNATIQEYAERMEQIIKDVILSSAGPKDALSLIAEAVKVEKIVSEYSATILINPVMKPSIYDKVGAGVKYGNVNISLVYNHRKWIKPAMVYGGSMDGVFRLSGGMLVGYYNNFVGQAVLIFNTLYGTDCIATEV